MVKLFRCGNTAQKQVIDCSSEVTPPRIRPEIVKPIIIPEMSVQTIIGVRTPGSYAVQGVELFLSR